MLLHDMWLTTPPWISTFNILDFQHLYLYIKEWFSDYRYKWNKVLYIVLENQSQSNIRIASCHGTKLGFFQVDDTYERERWGGKSILIYNTPLGFPPQYLAWDTWHYISKESDTTLDLFELHE